MSIIRKVFMSVIRCIGCGFVGALGPLILAVCACILVENVFAPNISIEVLIIYIGYCGIFVGFALGAIYGAIRTLTSLERRTILIALSVLSATLLLVSFLFDALLPISLLSLAPQPIEAGKPLSHGMGVGANPWTGDLHFSLAPGAPSGARISPQSGVFSWTPPLEQPAGKYAVTVVVSADGQRSGRTTFVITVTRPTPLVERKAPNEAGTDGEAKSPPKEITVDLKEPQPSGQGKARQTARTGGKTDSSPKELTVDLAKGVKLEMVLVPAGEFLMGSPESDKDSMDREKPQHRVRITKPFYLGKYLVTQEQWEAVMGSNPSNVKGPKKPVGTVSWDDCQKFLGKLDAKSAAGRGKFQLPSEAQWEYACRAGSTTRYCFGDDDN